MVRPLQDVSRAARTYDGIGDRGQRRAGRRAQVDVYQPAGASASIELGPDLGPGWDKIPPELRAKLAKYKFDLRAFREIQRAVKARELTTESSLLEGFSPPRPEEIRQLPAPDSAEGRRLKRLAVRALREGKIAFITLAGGMGTRFDPEGKGLAKGTVAVTEVETPQGKRPISFLQWAAMGVKRAAKLAGASTMPPHLQMGSFQTDDQLVSHLGDDARVFAQGITLRMDRDTGELWLADDGAPSAAANGHGDLFRALLQSPLWDTELRGVDMIVVKNVDNVAPIVEDEADLVRLGAHLDAIRHGRAMSAEVVEYKPELDGKAVGTPIHRDGDPYLQIVEGSQFPKGTELDGRYAANINTIAYSARALGKYGAPKLPVHLIAKKVNGREFLQPETVSSQLSSVRDSTGRPVYPMQVLQVPRSAFQPVKTPDDLPAAKARIDADLQAMQGDLPELLT